MPFDISGLSTLSSVAWMKRMGIEMIFLSRILRGFDQHAMLMWSTDDHHSRSVLFPIDLSSAIPVYCGCQLNRAML